MHTFEKGDLFEVTSESAPFVGYRGVVDEIEPAEPFSVVTTLTYQGKEYPCSYKPDEITYREAVLSPTAGQAVAG